MQSINELSHTWTFWLHLPDDNDWTINSYKKIYTFDSLNDAIILIENLNENLVKLCMLFIMKNNVKPIWEDENNRNGGYFSYKINVKDVYYVWKKLTY